MCCFLPSHKLFTSQRIDIGTATTDTPVIANPSAPNPA